MMPFPGMLGGAGLELAGRVLLVVGVNGSIAWLAYESARWIGVQSAYGGFGMTAIVIGLALLHLATIGLGLMGLLGLPGILAVSCLAAMAAAFVRSRPLGKRRTRRQEDAGYDPIAWGLGMTLWAVAAWRGFSGLQMNFDSLEYHLPMILDWLATGRLSLSQVASWQAFYPANFELTILWLLAPLRSDTAVHLANILFAVLLTLSAASLALRMGLTPRARSLVIACTAATPITVANIPSAQVDLAWAALYLASWEFGLAYVASRSMAPLAISATALGLFVGMKFSAPGYALLLIAMIWYMGWRARSLRPSSSLMVPGWYMVGLVTFGGYWYIRNFAMTGNPIYPARMQLPGGIELPGPVEWSWLRDTSLAASTLDLKGLMILLYKAGVALGPLASMVAIGIVLFPVLVAADWWLGSRRFAPADRLLACVVLCAFLLNLHTPFSRVAANWKIGDGFGITTFVEQSYRYGQMYIVGSYLAAARLLEKASGGIGFGFVMALGAMFQALEVGGWVFSTLGIRAGLPALLQTYAEIGFCVALAALSIGALRFSGLTARPQAAWPRRLPRAPMIAAGMIFLILGTAYGVRERETRWTSYYGTYPREWFPDESALRWVMENATPTDSLAVVGFARPSAYALMGPRLQTRVVYALADVPKPPPLVEPRDQDSDGSRPTILVVKRNSVSLEGMRSLVGTGRWELAAETLKASIYRRRSQPALAGS